MYTQYGLILTAFTTCASAQMAPMLARRTPIGNIKLAATETGNQECTSSVRSWVTSMPTPNAKLESALSSNSANYLPSSTLADLCAIATAIQKDQAPAYTKFNNELYSYFSGESTKLVAMATNCPKEIGSDSKSFVNELNDILAVYSSFSAGSCDKPATVTSTSASIASSNASPTASPVGPSATTPTTNATPTSDSGRSRTVNAANIASTSIPSSSGFSTTTSAETTTSISSSPSSSALDTAETSGTSTIPTTTSSTPTANGGPRETGMLAAAAVVAAGIAGAIAAF
ncbi:hypothetical protein F5B20DRAFT_364981 [Whalleya microplaca]|nr:hypothetical protein F5B20DRAFT_364981 [Whalleya microplaca]